MIHIVLKSILLDLNGSSNSKHKHNKTPNQFCWGISNFKFKYHFLLSVIQSFLSTFIFPEMFFPPFQACILTGSLPPGLTASNSTGITAFPDHPFEKGTWPKLDHNLFPDFYQQELKNIGCIPSNKSWSLKTYNIWQKLDWKRTPPCKKVFWWHRSPGSPDLPLPLMKLHEPYN